MAEQQQYPIGDSIYTPTPYAIPLGGVAPDIPADALGNDYLASAKNFVVRNGLVARREGYDTQIGESSPPQSAAHSLFEWIPYDNSARVVLATPTRFYYFDTAGNQWVNITTTARTGTYNNAVFFTPMRTSSSGVKLISVNGVDQPAWWDGGTSTAFIYMNGSSSVIGACSTVWRSHFLQGDTTDTGDGHVSTRVHWSALGDPTVWFGTASAGSLDLIDTNATKVMTFAPLRNTLVAYKEQGAHMLIYKPAPFYFTQQSLHGGIALVSRKSMIPIMNGDFHFLFTKEGFVLYDGQAIDPIGHGKVDKTIMASLNWQARECIWCQWWPTTQEVLIGLPMGSSTTPNALWIYNHEYKSWWETDLAFISAQPIYKVYSTPRLFGSVSGVAKVYHLFTGITDTTAVTAISSSFQTGLQDQEILEHKEVYKLAVVMSPGTGTTTTVQISKAGTENPLVPLTFASAQSLTVTSGQGLPKIDFRLTDRWFSWRLTHSGASETVLVRGMAPYNTIRTDARKRR